MESEDSQCTSLSNSSDELSRDSSVAAKSNTADTQDVTETVTNDRTQGLTATTDTHSNSSSSSKSNSSSSSSSSGSSDSEDDGGSCAGGDGGDGGGKQDKDIPDNCENSNKTADDDGDGGGSNLNAANTNNGGDTENKSLQSSSSSTSNGGDGGSSSSSSSSDEGEINDNDNENENENDNENELPSNKLSSNSTSPIKAQQSPNSRQSYLSSIRSEHSNSPFNNGIEAINESKEDALQSHHQSHPLPNHNTDINISHEDLSDVSDLESEKQRNCFNEDDDVRKAADDDDDVEEEEEEEEGALSNDSSTKKISKIVSKLKSSNGDKQQQVIIDGDNDNGQDDLRSKINLRKKQLKKNAKNKDRHRIEDLNKSHDDDVDNDNDNDSLDFEAEEGECHDTSKEDVIAEVVDDVKKDGGANNNIDRSNDNETKKIDNKKEKVENNEDGGVSGIGDATDAAASKAEDGQASDDDDDGGDEVAKKNKEDLEEGEVTDEDEKRPEETEPKPICRFYTRGQCTWGMSCRFLHPGVTDKGNYTMFESMVRSVPMPQGGGTTPRASSNSYGNHSVEYHDYRNERPPIHHRPPMHHPYGGGHHDGRGLLPEVPVIVENAWERGLRTAKEMMRKANKRKEQDMDFEDKKMNLTLSPDELDKDPYYSKERGSSPTNYAAYSPQDRFNRGPQYMGPYDDVDAYGRMARYRELPPHRMPQYEDDRRLRPTREVIVQRVETGGRGDEWNDPWMRSKSPGGRSGSYDRGDDRRRRDRGRSYSSNSSYSSSNSSQSDSSSDSSRSSRSAGQKRRYGGAGGGSHGGGGGSHKIPPPSRRHIGSSGPGGGGPVGGRGRSPTPVGRGRARRSPGSASPKNYKRGAIDKRSSGYSPSTKRRKMISSPSRRNEKGRRRHSSSSSDSDSSGSSYSDSDSGSSSSESSSGSKDRAPQKIRSRGSDKAALASDRKPTKKLETPIKKRSPISIEIKKPTTVGVSALVSSPTHSSVSDKDSNKKSRREELLKQLRAVEDAIAKKRSKLA